MKTYGIWPNITEHPSNVNFQLHVHDGYEIYLFLEGDSKFVIEENTYDLEPGDIIIIRKNQLHRVYHCSNKQYNRIVINLSPEFFEGECARYEEQFTNPEKYPGNKIDAKTVRTSGIYDAIMRIKKYSDNFKNKDSLIVKCIIIELLHLMDNTKLFSESAVKNTQLMQIIEYINKNYTTDISLSDIEKKFFISKYHLCHIFPGATGLTVYQYITKKRLAYARELIKTGMTISDSAEKAGFNNYSSFYRAYTSEYNATPQADKKR